MEQKTKEPKPDNTTDELRTLLRQKNDEIDRLRQIIKEKDEQISFLNWQESFNRYQ